MERDLAGYSEGEYKEFRKISELSKHSSKIEKEKSVKTCVCYDSMGESAPVFFDVDKDLAHLDGFYINECDTPEDISDELLALCFDKDGNFIQKRNTRPSKDWDFFITIGFVP